MITYNKLIKKTISFLLVFMILISNLTNTVLFSEETSKYPYTLFGRNGITISTLSNLSINGNIHTNKEASVSSQNKNVNGRITTGNDIEKRVKHVYADKKIYQTYFTQNCELYESEYVRSELNININNPVFSYENIIFNGNVSLNSNIGTYMDINITGEVKNANNSVVYSKYGDITIENNSTANINGLIYAPLGTLTINAPNINLGGIIIADEVIINGSNVNINCNDNIARFIGTTSEAYDFSGLEYLPEEWLGDTDLDDLFDIYEKVIDTDPLNPDTDFDELPDGYEVLTLNTAPLEVDTDLNGIWDKDEDFDSDNLSNLGEYQNKTEPFIPDSDEDGLLDGDEVHTYGTDPLNPDTDADKLLDGEEGYSGTIFTKYGVYFDPLMPDTDGNGILDGDEIFGQSKQQQVQTHDGAIVGVYVNMNTNGNLDKNLSIENVYNIDMLSSNVVGLVGDPFEFKATTNFDSATITFEFDQYKVNGVKLQNLIVLWYDEENQRYMECSEKNGYYTKIDNSAISVTTTHFSKYMVVDKIAWYEAWEQSFQRFYYAAPSGAGQPNQVPIDHYNTVFVVDTSGSMSDDPNGEWLGYDSIKKLYTKPMPPISDPAMYDYWWKTYGYYSCKRITACENFIDTMYPNDNAAIISFAYGNNQYTKVQAFLSSDKEYLKNSLQSFYDDGGTCFSYAINMAVELIPENEILKNNVVNRIVFLSDGEPENDTLTDINVAIDNAKAKGIKIYTIGLGIENTVLSNMAIDTGGKSYEGIEASELPRVVSQATSPHSNDPNPDFNSLMNMHSDDDNLPDLVEQFGLRPNGQPLGTYVDILDSDGDGLSDGDEVTFNRDEFVEGLKSGDCSRGIKMISDPLLEDGDGDGLDDYEEDILSTSPISTDTDRDKLSDGLEVDLWFDPLDKNPDGDGFYDYDEWLNNTSPFVYNLTLAESKEAFLKGAALGDWVTADNIETLLGQISFSFVPFAADARDYFANVFVNLDTWAAIFNVGGFVLDFIPAAGVAGDATKALPKLGRFVAKYADDAPKVVEAIIRSSKLFPNADEVLPGLVKILPAEALDDIAGSIKNGDKITKADYTELQKVFEAAGRVNNPSAKGLIGKHFEDYLTNTLGGGGSFSKGGRDFDGGIDNRWWEAKSGNYWNLIMNDTKKLELFKSSMGDRLRIAKDNGATYELLSNTPIPQTIKDWLTKKGIPYTELLD